MSVEVGISLAVSVLAFGISLIALWGSQLQPFSPGLITSDPSFRVYAIHSRKSLRAKVWYLPSFDISITAWNKGAKPGVLSDMRMRVTIQDRTGGIEQFIFRPVWMVDFAQFEKATDRFSAISAATSRWYGVPLPDRTPRTLHLMFEAPGRWDQTRPPFHLRAELEYTSSARDRWVTHATFEFQDVQPFTGDAFILSNVGTRRRPAALGRVHLESGDRKE
jgi:hypothetical protein